MTNSNNNSLRNRHDINMSMTTSTSPLSPNHTTIPFTWGPFPSFIHDDVVWYVSRITYHKKNSKIDTVSMDILFEIKSTQLNDIKFMWEKLKEYGFRPVKRRVTDRCYSTKRRKTDGEETTAQREGITVRINGDTPPTQRRRHNNKYVYVSTGVLSYSIHIQFFSQNQSLLSPI